MMKKILIALFIAMGLSLLLSLYGFITSVLVDMFTPPIGAFATLGLDIAILIFLTYLVFYPAPVVLAVMYIRFSRKNWSGLQLKTIGLAVGVITNSLYYLIMMLWSMEFEIPVEYLIGFFVHSILVAAFSMILFGKLRNSSD
jgi:hypothetical protein